MKKLTLRSIVALSIFVAAFFTSYDANAWTDVADGYTYQDEDGCMHHVHSQELRIFGITIASRTVDDTVAC